MIWGTVELSSIVSKCTWYKVYYRAKQESPRVLAASQVTLGMLRLLVLMLMFASISNPRLFPYFLHLETPPSPQYIHCLG